MISTAVLDKIHEQNPWLDNVQQSILGSIKYIPRQQAGKLLSREWDRMWLILTGPRQAGKTTMGRYLCQRLLAENRFSELLYLNCDELLIRDWIKDAAFVSEIMDVLQLKRPIFFLDEVQRVTNPGLLLKAIVDLHKPIKLIASGSSQLEIKSKVQEHLTGRLLESLVLPFSYSELRHGNYQLHELLIYGCYPQIVTSSEKRILLQQLFNDYIRKDIVEFLKIGLADAMQKLITLVAHSSGQLVNYSQLANDCKTTVKTVQHYLSILEQTFVVSAVKPFTGNKRAEITSNPIYYFLDNGFRNQALQNFTSLEQRTDAGLLVESAVFQEIMKFRAQTLRDFNIMFWRTKSGAEVDFILKYGEKLLPIEVKYTSLKQPKVTRSFRSFVEAYKPEQAIFVTKDLIATTVITDCTVHFIPLTMLHRVFDIVTEIFS